MNIFSRIVDLLFPPRESDVLVRSCSYDSLAQLLSPRFISIANTPLTSLLPYREPLVRALIQEAKFHNNTKATEQLGDLLGEYLLSYGDEEGFSNGPVVILPIPLSAKREKERGYNQVEEIAKRAMKTTTSLSLRADILSRTRNTQPQTKLSRDERLKNMDSAFLATGVNSNHTYIVVDDVVTTGATLLSAHKALTSAGVTKVHLLALAH